MKKVIAFLTIICLANGLKAQITVAATEAKNHIGQIVSICDRIVDGRFLETTPTKPTLLNVGGVYPDNIFTVVINFESRANFSFKPEEFYLNKKVCVTGKVVDFKGKPQIVVLSPGEIQVDEQTGTTTNTPTSVSPNSNVTSGDSSTTINSIIQNKAGNTDILSSPVKKDSVEKAKMPVSSVLTKAPVKTEGKTVTPATPENKNRPDITPDNIYTIKLTNDVNLRASAAVNAEVLELIKAGSVVSILSSANGWSYVAHKRYSEEQKADVEFKGYVKNSVLK
jgi:hypothetical protein